MTIAPYLSVVDVATLERVALRMNQDSSRGAGLGASAVRSISGIILAAIGAPISWPSREAGCAHADDIYPGSPDLRAAFNNGVKWAVEHYNATEQIKSR